MLLVPVADLAVPAPVVVRSLQGEAFFDSCRGDPVAPGGHLAVCGPLRCPSIVGGHDHRSDDSHLPYCYNPRNDGNCRCDGDNRPLGDSHRLSSSRNRHGFHRRACSLRRGSNRPPNRGCHLYICCGGGVSQALWELVGGQWLPFASFVALFVLLLRCCG